MFIQRIEVNRISYFLGNVVVLKCIIANFKRPYKFNVLSLEIYANKNYTFVLFKTNLKKLTTILK